MTLQRRTTTSPFSYVLACLACVGMTTASGCLSSGTEFTDTGDEVTCEADTECEHGSCQNGVCSDDRCPTGFVDANNDRATDGCECSVDELVSYSKYEDNDRDGAFIEVDQQLGCTGAPAGFEPPREDFISDCDDDDPTAFPRLSSGSRDDAWLCDGIDNDCDNAIDESCCTPDAVRPSTLAPYPTFDTNPYQLEVVQAPPSAPAPVAYLAIWHQSDTLRAVHLDDEGHAVGESVSHSYSPHPTNSDEYPQARIRHLDVITVADGYEVYWWEAYYAENLAENLVEDTVRVRGIELGTDLVFPDTHETFTRFLYDSARWSNFEVVADGDTRLMFNRLNTSDGTQVSLKQFDTFQATDKHLNALHGEPIETAHGRSEDEMSESTESNVALTAHDGRLGLAWLHLPAQPPSGSTRVTVHVRTTSTTKEAVASMDYDLLFPDYPAYTPTPFLTMTDGPDGATDLFVASALPSPDPDDHISIRMIHFRLSDGAIDVIEEYLWAPDDLPDDHLIYDPVLTPLHTQADAWRVVWLEQHPDDMDWRLRQATTDWEASTLQDVTTIWRGTDNARPGLVPTPGVGLAYREAFGNPYRFHAIPVSHTGQPLCP